MTDLNKELLYGTGTRERIVAVEVPRGQENQAHLFIRTEDDEIVEKYEHYNFRVLLNENDPVLDELYGAEIIELLGYNFYNRMVVTDQYSTYRFITKNADDAYEPFLQTQWFLETQDCQFKGMLYEDTRVMYPDLEVLTKKGYKFPNPSREEDKIIAIAIKTNRDQQIVLTLNDDGKTSESKNIKLYDSEPELIKAFISSVQKFDPDIIANHNCFLPETKIQLYNGKQSTIKELVSNPQETKITNIKHNDVTGLTTPSKDVTYNKDISLYKDDIIILETNCSLSLKSTKDHPHYGFSKNKIGYHEANSMSIGDLLAKPIKIKSPNDYFKYCLDDYFFAGLMLSDGHINEKGNQMYFSNTNNNLLKWVGKYLDKNQINHNDNTKQKEEKQHKELTRIVFTSPKIKSMLFDLGVSAGNKSKENRSIDLENVYRSTNTLSFLSGFVAGDGHLANNYIHIAINNTSIKDWIVSMCRKEGLLSYVVNNGVRIIPTINQKNKINTLIKNTMGKNRKYKYVSDVDRVPNIFIEYISPFLRGKNGYVNEYYETKNRRVYTGLSYDDFSLPKTTINYIVNKRTTISRKSVLTIIKDIENNLHKFSNKKKQLWKQQKNKIQHLLDFYWFEIKEKNKKQYRGFVYNFGTGNKNYIANGFLTHNCFNFDFEYLRARCDLHGIKMALGRDGSVPYHHPSKIKFAGRERQYTNYKIYGRHVIDTQFLAEQYDVFARELPGVGLKSVAKFLTKKYDAGITREGRVYIDGDDIADVWRNEHHKYKREDLLEYALDDVYEAEGLYKFFYSANFDCTKFMPMPYQDVFRYGSGNKLEYLLLRNYINSEVSWAKPDEREDFEGGYADVLEYGLIDEPQVYVDVSSLYPWSIIEQQINPPKDILGLFLSLVVLTRDLRFQTKFQIPDVEGKEERRLKAADAALKIVLNSWYGYLGYEWGSMNYYEGARKTTELGREVMRKMVERAQVLGAQVVKLDTDGMLCTVPPAYNWGEKKGELDFIKVIEQQLNKNYKDLKLDHDGRYEKTMIIDKKSYILKEYDGTLTFKGNTIKGRNLQPFTVKFLKKAIDFVFENDYIGVRNEFDYWKSMIESGLIEAENLKTRKTLGMTLSDYQHKIESGNNPITQYELALKSERKYTMGDAVEYYVSAPPMIKKEYKTVPDKWVPKKMANYEKAKMLDEYDNDPDVKYYIERLEKTVKKLIVVFGEDKFTELFPEISIHKKDRTKLKLLKEQHG